MNFETLIPVIVLALVVLSGFRRTSDSERIVVFRLGRPNRLAGPGLVWIAPLVERGIRIHMDVAVPDWRSLSDADHMKKALGHLSKPAGPSTDNASDPDHAMSDSPTKRFKRLWLIVFVVYFVGALIALYVYSTGALDSVMPDFPLAVLAPVFVFLSLHAICTGEVGGGEAGRVLCRSKNPIMYWVFVAMILFIGIGLLLVSIGLIRT
ncbi:MAG: hypothetical protein HY725_18575 [Candidatus Rokubacteria bacterium]|nr:hypothetical protein [Candidatus Rokubacteria bacterium]